MSEVHTDDHGVKRPLISFLTTAYKTEPYVAETIESVLAQTRDDWELIIVDNGNSDEMATIVSGYISDPRITLIRQENAGIRGGVRAAAEKAWGRYVCPLHSDDLLESTYCQRVGALVEATPTIDAIGFNATFFWDQAGGEQTAREYFADIGRGGRGALGEPTDYFHSIGRKSAPGLDQPVTMRDLLDNGVPHYIGVFAQRALACPWGIRAPSRRRTGCRPVAPGGSRWRRRQVPGRQAGQTAYAICVGLPRPRQPATARERTFGSLSSGRPGIRLVRESLGGRRDGARAAIPERTEDGENGTAHGRRAVRAPGGSRGVRSAAERPCRSGVRRTAVESPPGEGDSSREEPHTASVAARTLDAHHATSCSRRLV